MILVDTNVLLHAVNRDSPECVAAREALEALANGHRTWALSWTIAYEFLRVATHPRVFPRPMDIADAWAFLHGLISRPTCLLLTERDSIRRFLAAAWASAHACAGTSCTIFTRRS